ncbi:MAG: serine O-acetyltransferase [Candidatus Latescibacteria bacterium]|jgi:serine O-acetyltransferase|nr:serine O-acetyltransferase [Candidatus Latescibacterota bacterium]
MFRDIKAVFDRDPAARGFWGLFEVVFTYAGLHALWAHRIAHTLSKWGLPFIPRLISQVARFVTGIEIHPAARIGAGFFIDHGMGIVIGETAEIGDDCTLFQGVTLGGTGKETGKRHPTLANGIVVGAGAKILGNITIGDNVLIGANTVVLDDVPPDSTVVGVRGRVVRHKGKRIVMNELDHSDLPDPIIQRLDALHREILSAEEEVAKWRNSEPRA